MLPGFEDITIDLKPAEQTFVKEFMVAALSVRIGQNMAITNKKMRFKLFEYTGVKISDAKIRKYVQYIRIHNLVPKLVSTSKGYFVAREGTEEWEKWKSSMHKRAREILYTVESAEYFNDGKETL